MDGTRHKDDDLAATATGRHIMTSPDSLFGKLRPHVAALALIAAGIALLLALASGPAYRLGLIDLGTAFPLLFRAFTIAAIAAGIGLAGYLWSRVSGDRRAAGRFAAAFLLAAVVAASLWLLRADAGKYVPIHDVTTDMTDPPAFVAITPRSYGERPNGGRLDPTWAEKHRAAYADIRPLQLDLPPAGAFAAALEAARDMGWEIVAAEPGEGRIEATDTTLWFGFKDDIVIRIAALDDGTARLDIRSVSRVGVSDIGANAARIRAWTGRLRETVRGRS